MKALFAILVSCLFAPEQGIAGRPAPAPAPKLAVCEKEAHDLAVYIERMSRGRLNGDVANTVKASHDDRAYTYDVKVDNAKNEGGTGYTYTIDITQDYRSEACIVTNVSTNGTDQAE